MAHKKKVMASVVLFLTLVTAFQTQEKGYISEFAESNSFPFCDNVFKKRGF